MSDSEFDAQQALDRAAESSSSQQTGGADANVTMRPPKSTLEESSDFSANASTFSTVKKDLLPQLNEVELQELIDLIKGPSKTPGKLNKRGDQSETEGGRGKKGLWHRLGFLPVVLDMEELKKMLGNLKPYGEADKDGNVDLLFFVDFPGVDDEGNRCYNVVCPSSEDMYLGIEELSKISGRNIKVNTCGRCKNVKYCSRECQKADFESFHKGPCKRIGNLLNKLERWEPLLKEETIWNGSEKLFGPRGVGHFWFILNDTAFSDPPYNDEELTPREYVRALSQVADMTALMAEHYEERRLFEKAVEIYLECLRLARADGSFDGSMKVPFLLLVLGRLQDTYDFVKWNLLKGSGGIEYTEEYVYGEKGSWLYCKGEDMYEDLLSLPCITQHEYGIHLCYLCPLVALKLLLVHKMQKKLEKAESFMTSLGDMAKLNANGPQARSINDGLLMETLLAEYFGENRFTSVEAYAEEFARQKIQLDGLLSYVRKKNKYLLYGMMHPEGYLDCYKTPPQYYGYPGTRDEAYDVMMRYWKMFLRLPNIKEFLLPHVGTKKPSFSEAK
eukprot:Nk52_evm91s62 gene=Nk52_evmTU91s62